MKIFKSLLIVFTISFIFTGVLYSCDIARNKYYNAQKECIINGGTWIPQGGNDSYKAMCIRSK